MNFFFQNIRAFYWLTRKNIFRIPDKSVKPERDDHIASFDEFVPCPVCNNNDFIVKFMTLDGMLVNKCTKCGLLQTRPRIKEKIWEEWLKSDSERSRRYTENRLRYGYALDEYIKYSSFIWFIRIRLKYRKLFRRIERVSNRSINKVHDVGCGVGFLMREAKRMNMGVSGNDLNQYSVNVMKERFGLNVTCGTLKSTESQKLLEGSDLVTMTDYIEHSYHPESDLKITYDHLAPKGLVYLCTFHIGCELAEKLGSSWEMYQWNHIYHFDRKNLEELVTNAGFRVIYSHFPYTSPHCEILAEK